MENPEAVVAELNKIAAYLNQETKRVTAEYGLSQQQFTVLKAIREKGPAMQRDLSSEFMVEKSGMSKSVAKLVSMGLAEREISPDDGRVWFVRTTPRGDTVVQECLTGFEETNKVWLENVDKKTGKKALKILKGLSEAIPGMSNES